MADLDVSEAEALELYRWMLYSYISPSSNPALIRLLDRISRTLKARGLL